MEYKRGTTSMTPDHNGKVGVGMTANPLPFLTPRPERRRPDSRSIDWGSSRNDKDRGEVNIQVLLRCRYLLLYLIQLVTRYNFVTKSLLIKFWSFLVEFELDHSVRINTKHDLFFILFFFMKSKSRRYKLVGWMKTIDCIVNCYPILHLILA